MVCVGLVGYAESTHGLKAMHTVWAGHLSDEVKRRFYKNWYRAKKKAFTKYAKTYQGDQAKIQTQLKRVKDYCQVVRAICHTQISKVKLGQKKAHVAEIQVNCGSMADKVDFATKLFEQQVPVASIFEEKEMIDTV